MNSEAKLLELEKIEDRLKSLISQLINFTIDEDEEVRQIATETLGLLKTSQIIQKMRDGLLDKDELVRVTCLEILGDWKDNESVSQIKECLSDGSWIVRSEAAIALSSIGIKDAVMLIEKKIPLAGDEEKNRYYFALYQLGKFEYFSKLLDGLFHEHYRIRCATANLLPNIVSPTNKELILRVLHFALKNEKTKAAKSSMKNTIKEINEIKNEGQSSV